eukprot:6718908-Lingulodinium_polyedra.AAC.1
MRGEEPQGFSERVAEVTVSLRPVLADAAAVDADGRPVAAGDLGPCRRSLVGGRQVRGHLLRWRTPARGGGRATYRR